MNHRAMAIAVAAFVFAVATPAVPADEPKGMHPVTGTTLADVLRRHDAAVGTGLRPWRTFVEVDAVSASGEAGTERLVQAGSDYRLTDTLGPLTTSEGERNGRHWRLTENGLVIRISGIHKGNESTDVAVVRGPERALHDAASNAALAGQVDAPQSAYVIKLAPAEGSRRWVFIDRRSYQIVRVDYDANGDTISGTYDDFRATNGVTRPWRGHVAYAGSAKVNDIDWHVVSLQYDATIAPAELDIPSDQRRLIDLPSGMSSATVPVQVINGAVIVRAQIGNRGVDLQVDSGASGIFLNRGLVKQLGLKTFGPKSADSAGRYEPSYTLLPDLQLGDAHMRNVVVHSLPWYYQPDSNTQVEGLIGFDLLASGFVKLDYINRELTLADWRDVTFPAGQSFIVPIALDDGVPVAGARVVDAVGNDFIVDTGDAFGIMIFRHFADAHPQSVSDQGYGKALHYLLPFVWAAGVGGRVDVKPTQVKAFHFGGVGFEDFTLFVAQNKTAFGAEDYDGLIGYGFLEFFDIYFDYHNSRIILQPNKLMMRVVE